MVGSTLSISGPNFILNTIFGKEFQLFADELEKATDFKKALHDIIVKTITEHERILFNGNGYDDSWIEEAEKRGLLNLKTTPDCLPYFIKEKNIKLFTEAHVLTETEIFSRYEIILESYCKVIGIEANTMLDMAKKDILPAVSAYSKELADTAIAKHSLIKDCACSYEEEIVKEISELTSELYKAVKALEDAVDKATESDVLKLALYYKDVIIPAMDAVRTPADKLELITAKKYWPFPTYGDLLFGVR